MSKLIHLAIGMVWWLPTVAWAMPSVWSVTECVDTAVQKNARIEEANAKVHEFAARLAEIESVYYPKLVGLAFVAPNYTVHLAEPSQQVTTRYKSLKDWGPYTNLELLLAQPLYTFGRAEKGAEAAAERAQVERARLRETRNAVALEARRMYYTHVFALSMLPVLKQAGDVVHEAQVRAKDLYEKATGEVTQVDLAKLDYGLAEISRYTLVAQDGATLAMAALTHVMGLPTGAVLRVADNTLQAPSNANHLQPLAELYTQASANRPEWAQLEHGKRAALAYEQAEKLANWPVVFLAGQLKAAYTPTRSQDTNPYHYDVYNTLVGGVALGLKFDLDPALATAKASSAHAQGEQVEALRRFAATGIPLQVHKAYDDVDRAQRLVALAKAAVMATRQWMAFAATAYGSGTGEARDLLEGLVAYVQARRTYYENLQAYYISLAELTYAVGET